MAQFIERLGPPVAARTETSGTVYAKPLGLEAWYARRYAIFWCVANLAMLILLLIGPLAAARAGPLATWGAFIALNALLYPSIARRTPPGSGRQAGASHVLQVAIAAVFGLAWGLAPLLFAAHLGSEPLAALALLVAFMALFAIPVFGVYRHAYAAHLTAFAVPYCYALFATAGAASGAGLLALIALAALAFERLLVRPLRVLRHLVNTLDAGGVWAGDPAAIDDDFPRRVAVQAFALEERLCDQAADRQVCRCGRCRCR